MKMIKLMDFIFICSAIIFNISVSLVYLSTKFDNMVLLQVSGLIVIFLIVPFSITLYGYLKKGIRKKDYTSPYCYSLLSISGIIF